MSDYKIVCEAFDKQEFRNSLYAVVDKIKQKFPTKESMIKFLDSMFKKTGDTKYLKAKEKFNQSNNYDDTLTFMVYNHKYFVKLLISCGVAIPLFLLTHLGIDQMIDDRNVPGAFGVAIGGGAVTGLGAGWAHNVYGKKLYNKMKNYDPEAIVGDII